MKKLDIPKPARMVIDDGIVLEPIAPHHAPELFAVTDANRDILENEIPQAHLVATLQDTKQFINKSIDDAEKRLSYLYAIMVGGQIAGTINMRWANLDNNYGAMGYWLGQSYQGCGIVTKCVKTVTQYAFDCGIKTMEIGCSAKNIPSQNVAIGAGYTFYKEFPNVKLPSGELTDAYLYLKTP